jgi:hypothetical protein
MSFISSIFNYTVKPHCSRFLLNLLQVTTWRPLFNEKLTVNFWILFYSYFFWNSWVKHLNIFYFFIWIINWYLLWCSFHLFPPWLDLLVRAINIWLIILIRFIIILQTTTICCFYNAIIPYRLTWSINCFLSFIL